MEGIMIELILWSENPEIPIDEISQSIGIFPVEEERIGETKYFGKQKKLSRRVEVSSLLYATDYVNTTEVETALHEMACIITPKLETIQDVVCQYGLKVSFCVVIKLNQKPTVIIPLEFIQIMAKLSADIEFDTYITRKKSSRLLGLFHQITSYKGKRKSNSP